MSSALPGMNYCEDHQGNHSHYAKHNCVVCTLIAALEAAHAHLEYCGYGDSWERECAVEEKLDQKITDALTLAGVKDDN